MIKKIREDIYNYRFAIIAVILYIFLMQLIFKSLCPIKALFGIDCPGCGLTHATIYLVTGNFKEAMNTNFTVLLWLGLLIAFLIDRYIYKFKNNLNSIWLILAGIITIARYVIIIILYQTE